MENIGFLKKFLDFRFFLHFSVQRRQGIILRPRNNILYTILNVALFLLSEWCDVWTQNSRLKYEMKLSRCVL